MGAPSDELEPISEFPNIVGKSEKIREICQRIGQVAKTDSTVLIYGESGTGLSDLACFACRLRDFSFTGDGFQAPHS